MESDFKSKVAYVVLSLAIAGACVYFMLSPLHREATTRTREYLKSPHAPGPFDEAMKESLRRMGG